MGVKKLHMTSAITPTPPIPTPARGEGAVEWRCVDTYAFKGRTEVGHGIAHRAFLFLPFKGRTEVGMGLSA